MKHPAHTRKDLAY